MKIRLDGIYSPTLPSGYGEMPNDPFDCWVTINADIGTNEDEGVDCFTLYITTPKYLLNNTKDSMYKFGRGILIINKFDWNIVESAIKYVCDEIEVDSWEKAVCILSKFFFYEFE